MQLTTGEPDKESNDFAAVRMLIRRLNKGQSGWMLFDKTHRVYYCAARSPRPDDDSKDLVGYYVFGACRQDVLEDIAQYERDNPTLKRRYYWRPEIG